MRLSDALRIGGREIVALVGAGGKTSALYRLAGELRAQGRTVIATTTTHMWPPPEGWPLVLGAGGDEGRAQITQAIAGQGRAFVAAALTSEGRLQGIAPAQAAGLAALADVVLVEADGARGLWLKAPAEHEPVIPPAATLVVPVAGLQAVGRPLDEAVVHRPERVAALLQVPLGSILTEASLAGLLVDERGGLRGVPAGARVVPLLNQADDEGTRAAGRRIAARVLQAHGPVRRVVVGSLRQAPEAFEDWAPSAVIVLAAGGARRYGRLKQAEQWQGRPFLARVAAAALGSLATEVHIVLGCEAGRLSAMLNGLEADRLRVTMNAAWAEGQASSLRAGLEGLPESTQSAVFCMADQPLLSSREFDLLLVRHAATRAAIVAPRCQGSLRSPALFARPLFDELAALQGDCGGRVVMQRHPGELEAVEAEDPRPYVDVDTEDDYRLLLEAN